MPSGINDDRPDFARHEVEVDDDPGSGGAPKRNTSVTWLVLGASLALTVLLAKYGIWFLFLPIIIPFGLGSRSLFGRAPSHRRLRLDGNVLSLVREGLGGSERDGSLDASAGVFLAVAPSGPRAEGATESVVRVVGSDGALEVLVADVARARLLKHRIAEMIAAASVRSLERTTPLQGGIDVRTSADGVELEWLRRRTRPWAGRGRTLLRVGPEGWTLQVYSGSRLESSTGGPGLPEARLTTSERADWTGSGIVESELVLELSWEGEVTARIGAELSEPELRFIAARLGDAQPSRRLGR